MVDDQVSHHVHAARDGADVRPAAEARVDTRVVDRIEARVGAVDGIEERQQVHAAEQVLQRPGEQRVELGEPAAGEPIHVSDQLDLVLHGEGVYAR